MMNLAPNGEYESSVSAQFAAGLFPQRSRNQWLAFIPAVVACGLSWMMGGVPRITDVGFCLLTAVCLVFFVSEMRNFSRRFGVGGLLLYGGVLVWFCHDYFSTWFFRSEYDFPFRPETVAKAAFFYALFILCMSIGLRTGGGRRLQRLILSVPEPGGESAYLIIILVIFAIGLAPFYFDTAEPVLLAIYHGAFSSWTEPVKWIAGRSGNLNYNWSGYWNTVIQAGMVGGVLAVFFAILVSTRLWSKIVGWTIWLYWTLFIYNGGRRGELAFMVLPPIALLFIKYQSDVAMALRRHSFKAYTICGVLGLILLAAVQVQGTFRGMGLGKADWTQIDLVKDQGNTMFTEGLHGYEMIPDQHDFFGDRFLGEGLIRAYPEQLWWFVIGPIPRALWTTKPVDPLWEWYNKTVVGGSNGREGTTIAKGLVGTWYFNYGIAGVIEGGFLVGWLMGLCERCLQNCGGRPMGLLMSLGIAVWLFRLYRDFNFVELYAFMVGAVVVAFLAFMFRGFSGAAPQHPDVYSLPDHPPEAGYTT